MLAHVQHAAGSTNLAFLVCLLASFILDSRGNRFLWLHEPAVQSHLPSSHLTVLPNLIGRMFALDTA